MENTVNLSRRTLLQGAGALGAMGVFAALTGCSAPESSAQAESAVAFDEETEIVIVGAGTGIFGAMAAKKEGREVIVLEKSTTYGGTTFLSDKTFWAPGNHLESDEKRKADDPESVTGYMMSCDLYQTGSEELCLDFARNAGGVHEYANIELGVPMILSGFGQRDYYNFPGSGSDRSIHVDGEWSDVRDVIDSYGLDIRTGTEGTELITDDSGAVIGVVATSGSKSIRIKATHGVVLATGGFDHNEQMRKAFLRGPLRGTVVVPTNTGDGHRMGLSLGADLMNMSSVYATVSYVKEGEELVTDPSAFAHFTSRQLPGSIIVNNFGRRFFDEGASYDVAGIALSNMEAMGTDPALSGPATQILDSRTVADYGFPGGAGNTEKPDWVREYPTLEALAEGEGIEKEALLEEVERFASFCDTGIDLDFRRGESGFENPNGGVASLFVEERDDLPNKYLAKIENPPFFAAKVGLGSFSTSGGLAVNENAQVLSNGEPIPGLYAAGCTAASFVSGYPAGGISISSGLYRSIKAVDHALGLNLINK